VLGLRARDAMDRGLGYRLNMMIAAKRKGMGYYSLEDENLPRRDDGPNVDFVVPDEDEDEAEDSDDTEPDEETVAEGKSASRNKPVQRKKLPISLSKIEGYAPLFYSKLQGKKYPGAFVFDPKRGYYKDEAFGTFDFSSLYPSIMRAFNVCRTTQVRNPRCMDPALLHELLGWIRAALEPSLAGLPPALRAREAAALAGVGASFQESVRPGCLLRLLGTVVPHVPAEPSLARLALDGAHDDDRAACAALHARGIIL
jgi:hypothetical protein